MRERKRRKRLWQKGCGGEFLTRSHLRKEGNEKWWRRKTVDGREPIKDEFFCGTVSRGLSSRVRSPRDLLVRNAPSNVLLAFGSTRNCCLCFAGLWMPSAHSPRLLGPDEPTWWNPLDRAHNQQKNRSKDTYIENINNYMYMHRLLAKIRA